MRGIAVLTALATVLVLTVGAGQTREPQESTSTDLQLVQKFKTLSMRGMAFKDAITKRPCPSARKAIVYYRGKTWEYERLLFEAPRSKTNYPERTKGRCSYKRYVVEVWRGRTEVRRQHYEAIRSDPFIWHQHVIRTVFPEATEHRAIGVAYCETGGTFNTYAVNRTSGTSGLFQIHPGNRGRVLYWHGHGSMVIDGNLFDPWNNARIALYMSKGGYDWHEWAAVCQR